MSTTMLVPTCTVNVNFFENPEPSFAYSCINCAPAWQVSRDGTISPPSRQRVVQLRVGDPTRLEFAGIRISTEQVKIVTGPNFFNDTDLIVTSEDFPSETITIIDPMPTEPRSGPPVRIYYALGVRLVAGGRPSWDDPKIYNPPDG